ncbi:hypothetical protein AVEN_224255-1 [Araneus ventricosus]|uniref:Uncharacterized protein n=1 Tax=Araneus ventricosus TaxID=182803 RepID=A0A4Y2NIQ2_ARAVE|nr:hypothetical protein AVEN_224255-1 [Araneus ventricosus]
MRKQGKGGGSLADVRRADSDPLPPAPFFLKAFLCKVLEEQFQTACHFPSEQVKKNYHIQSYEFSQQQKLLFTGTSSAVLPATIPQDPGIPLHTSFGGVQQQQQIVLFPELKVSSITNVLLLGLGSLGAYGPQKLLVPLLIQDYHTRFVHGC